ncbi:MAG TPA: hypothetical protein VIY86_10290 [Pirellulaceae bacterium]
MRAKFYLYLLLALIALGALYFLWLVLRALYTIFADVRQSRELDELAEALARKRADFRHQAEVRLKNGCEHDFDDACGALPHDVCGKCGIARERPEGPCDHHWQVEPGIIPRSTCKLCGEHFSPVTSRT